VREIAKDKELCEAASPGVWSYANGTIYDDTFLNRHIAYICNSGVPEKHVAANGELLAISREALPHYIDRTEKAEAKVRVLEEALREISKGEGPFSQDHLKHAANCIENMKNIAITALAGDGPAEPA
jgi:hypothetical protein